MKIKHLFLVAAITLFAPPLLAGTPVDETRPLAPDGQLDVSNVKGAVVIRGWDKPEVHVTGTLGANTPGLDITGDGTHLTIKVKNEGGGGWLDWGSDSDMGPTRLELSVPKGVSLTVNVVSARVKATGLEGGKLDFNTVSGNLDIAADSPSVKLDSVSGDARLDGRSGELKINTVSGDVHVRRVDHAASAQTVSGDVRLAGGPLRKVAVDTVSGDIHVAASLAADSAARLHSMSGDIHLDLRGDADASLHAKSMSGDIRSAFGKATSSGYGPGSSLEYTLGDGGGRVTLESLSGDIDIRKGD